MFKDRFDNVAHACSASTSTNNFKTKSNQNSVVKLSCSPPPENHQTLCNSNKNCVHVSSKEQEQLNLKLGKRKKSSESSVSSEPEKGLKVISQKTNRQEIKLENLIHLLPDSQSGVLIKLPGENFKCVRCGKTSGTAGLGSIHIICCKASYKKNKSVILDDLVWVCTFCQNRFDSRANLWKHKTACPYPLPSNYLEDTAKYPKLVFPKGPIKKCGLTCRSSINFAKHHCKKRLIHMIKCAVILGHCPKYDFDSKKITFYQCRNCKKDFLERCMLKIHLKQCAPQERLNTIKPMYLQWRDYDDLHSFRQEIKLKDLNHLLPDSQSGVLQKLPGESENFKCVRCGKTSGTAGLGSIHIIRCKASYNKNKSLVLKDLLWVCTVCHDRFDSWAELMTHKTAYSYPLPSTDSEEED